MEKEDGFYKWQDAVLKVDAAGLLDSVARNNRAADDCISPSSATWA